MAIENVMNWLLGDAMIDLVTRPVSHGMKLWNSFRMQELQSATVACTTLNGIWLDCRLVGCSMELVASLLLCGSGLFMQKGARHGKFGSNTFVAGEWFDRLPKWV
ncbi:hypothetical protein JCGZ_04239 [Jatropha curcas]|uniref:Uncharacterized protein n=1 Tax=Jatropha curcas TaxID=180498 RepID=A0A067L6W2_JATCU|nr:hypothetical protein JCGZ_04239 [Jatropha curcas]